MVRQLKSGGNQKGPIRIVLADGVYPLTQPLELTPADSGTAEMPISYEAAPGTHPVFSGGIRITGWTVGQDGVWETRIPEVAAGKWTFEALWVNGRRAVRARTPNAGNASVGNVKEEVLEPAAKGAGRAKQAHQTFTVPADIAKILAGLTTAELQDANLLLYHKWDVTRRRIDSFDAASLTVAVSGEGMKPWNRWDKQTKFIVENVPTALDEPGEWFLSRNGVLRYWPRPGEILKTTEVIAPVTGKLLVIKGNPEAGQFVEHINFKGLHFRYAQAVLPIADYEPCQAAARMGAAIEADGARQIVFDDCEIAHVGEYAIWFRHGCQENRISHCLIQDLGAGGVRIGETVAPKTEAGRTGHITFDNNIIVQGGLVNPSAVGVLICHSADNQVTHNEIADLFYTGISIGWVWGYAPSEAKRNLIAFNHVHHIGKGLLSDMGGIYSLGASEGTVVRNNVFHDIEASTYGGWGLYTDEGSTGILFENNLVYNTKTGSFHQHYGKENIIRNNIFIDSRLQQLQATRVEEHLSFTFENNLVCWKTGPTLAGPWDKLHFTARNNCYWNTAGKPVTFMGKTLADWQAKGYEQGSQVADPGFLNPGTGDFRLSKKSPALKLGFKPFDWTQAGVYGDRAWIKLAKNLPMPPVAIPAE